ncbi:zf-HC2 domain-containing protein [Auritidibacter ignavus]|uniref:zf-HC2 domain-containing protein n=1 Tax=Auritidibacter ignavus TaxID=678932 RepID=UPI00244A7B85|nr:zf-HC2 domain-containing protein [Auritidibacter ignavus]WGH81668.1 zf-HC2 domain-containing protein [Auritidibacter ignavus]
MSKTLTHFTVHPTMRIDAYLEGALSPHAEAKVQHHLAHCPQCRELCRERALALDVVEPAAKTQERVNPSRTVFEVESAEPEDSSPETSTQDYVARLKTQDGVPGWKVVIGLGVICLVASGILLTAWFMGGQNTQASTEVADDELLPHNLRVSPLSYSTATTGGRSALDTWSLTESEHDAASAMTGSSAPLDMIGRRVATSSVPELRTTGWSVPRLGQLNMTQGPTVVNRGERWATISTTYTSPGALSDQPGDNSIDAQNQTVVRQCKMLDERDGVSGCAVDESLLDSDQLSPLEPSAEDAVIHVYPDESWTALFATDQTLYRVDSNTPKSEASGMIRTIAVFQRSLVSDAQGADDSVLDRVDDGLTQMFSSSE